MLDHTHSMDDCSLKYYATLSVTPKENHIFKLCWDFCIWTSISRLCLTQYHQWNILYFSWVLGKKVSNHNDKSFMLFIMKTLISCIITLTYFSFLAMTALCNHLEVWAYCKMPLSSRRLSQLWGWPSALLYWWDNIKQQKCVLSALES